MRKFLHVVPKDGNWAVRNENPLRVSKVTETQKDVIQYGRDHPKRNCSELLIHGKESKIRESNSYGNKPFPSKG